jgi:hypothetical protein
MTKKTPKTDESTPAPTAAEIITEELEAARVRIAERNGVKLTWPASIIAQMENSARIAVANALRPPPLKLPRPPRDEPPETSPPAETLEAKRRAEQLHIDGRRARRGDP